MIRPAGLSRLRTIFLPANSATRAGDPLPTASRERLQAYLSDLAQRNSRRSMPGRGVQVSAGYSPDRLEFVSQNVLERRRANGFCSEQLVARLFKDKNFPVLAGAPVATLAVNRQYRHQPDDLSVARIPPSVRIWTAYAPCLRKALPFWNGHCWTETCWAALASSGFRLDTAARLVRLPVDRSWVGPSNHSEMPYRGFI